MTRMLYPTKLFIPLGEKKWINANQRLFWRVRSERTKAWRAETAVRAQLHQLKPLPKAHIVAELRFPTNARRDPANWAPTAKACVDGLVDANVLQDDNHKFLIGPDMRIGPKAAKEDVGLALLIYRLDTT